MPALVDLSDRSEVVQGRKFMIPCKFIYNWLARPRFRKEIPVRDTSGVTGEGQA